MVKFMESAVINNEEYKVDLDVFEGPLDLLLYLIRKNDLEITDIPISIITEKYLEYLDAMKDLNVNVAGEYLLMAAELIQIKSRMLLPSDERGEEEPLEDDPRSDLQRRLLEYQRYKDAAANLSKRDLLYRDEYIPLSPERVPGRREVLVDESVFKLLEAFQLLVKRMPGDRVREVTIDRVNVNERIFQLVELIKSKETLPIEALMPAAYDRYDLVVTFLALLEMMKLMMIKVFQAGQFQTIYVTGILEDVSNEEALRLIAEEEQTS